MGGCSLSLSSSHEVSTFWSSSTSSKSSETRRAWFCGADLRLIGGNFVSGVKISRSSVQRLPHFCVCLSCRVASGLREGQVSPGVSGRGGRDFAEKSGRPHRLRFYGKQPVEKMVFNLGFCRRHLCFKLRAIFILLGRCILIFVIPKYSVHTYFRIIYRGGQDIGIFSAVQTHIYTHLTERKICRTTCTAVPRSDDLKTDGPPLLKTAGWIFWGLRTFVHDGNDLDLTSDLS